MTNINPGEKVLFDTNIFIYSALDHPKYGNSCTKLIHEVELGKIEGFVPTIVLNELLHRLMITEVIGRGFAVNTVEAIKILRNDKNMIQSLDICWDEIDRIFEMGFNILKEKFNTFAESLLISQRYFERVEWLRIWKP